MLDVLYKKAKGYEVEETTVEYGFDEEGKPAIGWSPELSEDEAAKRTYTILGKTSLTNANWSVVAPGAEANYNFFSVSVEMK